MRSQTGAADYYFLLLWYNGTHVYKLSRLKDAMQIDGVEIKKLYCEMRQHAFKSFPGLHHFRVDI